MKVSMVRLVGENPTEGEMAMNNRVRIALFLLLMISHLMIKAVT